MTIRRESQLTYIMAVAITFKFDHQQLLRLHQNKMQTQAISPKADQKHMKSLEAMIVGIVKLVNHVYMNMHIYLSI